MEVDEKLSFNSFELSVLIAFLLHNVANSVVQKGRLNSSAARLTRL
jgi:hypothetical protein